jgi:AraC-like DNA-binding protein
MFLWPILFGASFFQALFLIFVLCVRPAKNALAIRLLATLLALMALANFDDLLVATELYRSVPHLFGFSMNAMLAYGPLFWLYAVTVTDPGFQWKKRTWWHFLPFFVGTLAQIPFFFSDSVFKIRYIEAFLSGNLPLTAFGIGLFAAQLAQMLFYLWMTARLLRDKRRAPASDAFLTPFSKRLRWLRGIAVLFGLFFATALGLFLFNLAAGHYIPKATFVYTLVSSAILYFIAYHMMLEPVLIAPDFGRKYRTIRTTDAQEADCLMRLEVLMEKEKIYTRPDLKLAVLAAQLKISPHALSKLINDKFDMPFGDFINRYRVEEFMRRQPDPKYAHQSYLGIAYDVGFQSKSTFNAAFKKVTGKTPSDFKNAGLGGVA